MNNEDQNWLSRFWRKGADQERKPVPLPNHPPDLQTARRLIHDGEAILVDVREPKEWDAGHVSGALSLPLSWLKTQANAAALAQLLPADKVLITHCMKGIRSEAAAEILKQFGYNVFSLPQNANELQAAGLGKLN